MEEKTIPSKLPVMWKALQPKNSNEVYFVGNQKKKSKQKNRRKPLDLMVDQLEQRKEESPQHNTWSHNQVKEIFPQLKNQKELEDEMTEEIKVLSLEDLKIHTKRVTKKKHEDEKLWKAADFPSVEIGAEVVRGGDKIKAEHAAPKSFSLYLKKLQRREESNGYKTCGNDKVFSSTSSQTDHVFFAESYSDVNAKYLSNNLPPDLNKIFLNYLFERDELRRLLAHLLKLLCDSSGDLPQVSPVPLKTALSSSEKAFILSQIF